MTSAVSSARGQASATANQAARSPWVEKLGRFGLAARGVVWILVGVLAVRIATGDGGGERADKDGALRTVAVQPFGKVLLVLLAIGFAGYALWRFVQAAVERGDGGGKAWAKRGGYAARGAIYVALLATTIPLIMAKKAGGGGSSGSSEDSWTAKLLDAPFGKALVIGAGLALIGIGLWLGYRGIEKKFVRHLKTGEMTPTARTWAVRIGVAGHLARMVVFALIGWFLIQAAIDYNPDEAVGLDGALRSVAEADHGPILLGIVALGLVAFGIYSLVESRYREVLGS